MFTIYEKLGMVMVSTKDEGEEVVLRTMMERGLRIVSGRLIISLDVSSISNRYFHENW